MGDQRRNIYRRWESLKTERSSWMEHWREISENILPRNGRFLDGDSNSGGKKHNKIYDNTPIRALDILSAGLMGGLTSPSRPWFKLAMHDDEMNQFHEVKEWLAKVENMMLSVFQRSNIYGSLHSMYQELAAFGTAACIILPDYQDVIRCYPLTIGEYAVATNWRGEVDTIYRELEKSVGETVEDETQIGKIRRICRISRYISKLEQKMERFFVNPASCNSPRSAQDGISVTTTSMATAQP